MKKPRTVTPRQCAIISMCDGRGEKTHSTVIDEGIVKDYVGIGWIDIRKATSDDYKKYPTVKRP